MEWLTDADRRAAQWLRRTESAEHEHDGQPSIAALPNGGLRFDQTHRQGNLLTRYRAEDVTVAHNRIDRIHRLQQRRPRTMRVGWVMRERITVESHGHASTVSVRLRGRLTGLRQLVHLLGYHDTATARALAADASYRADFRVREITAQFGTADDSG